MPVQLERGPYRSPARADLGSLLRVHGRRSLGELLVKEAKDLGLVVFLGLTVCVCFVTRGAAEDPVRGPAYRWFAVVVLVAVALLLVVHLSRWAQLKRRVVAVHARGVAAEGPDGAFDARWDELAVVRVDTSVETTRAGCTTQLDVWLERADGASLHLADEVEGLDELAAHLLQQTRPHLLARLRERMASGGATSFGFGVVVSPDGVSTRATGTLPWRDIESVEVARGNLTIRSKCAVIERRVGGIENAHVLVELIERLSERPMGAQG